MLIPGGAVDEAPRHLDHTRHAAADDRGRLKFSAAGCAGRRRSRDRRRRTRSVRSPRWRGATRGRSCARPRPCRRRQPGSCRRAASMKNAPRIPNTTARAAMPARPMTTSARWPSESTTFKRLAILPRKATMSCCRAYPMTHSPTSATSASPKGRASNCAASFSEPSQLPESARPCHTLNAVNASEAWMTEAIRKETRRPARSCRDVCGSRIASTSNQAACAASPSATTSTVQRPPSRSSARSAPASRSGCRQRRQHAPRYTRRAGTRRPWPHTRNALHPAGTRSSRTMRGAPARGGERTWTHSRASAQHLLPASAHSGRRGAP